MKTPDEEASRPTSGVEPHLNIGGAWVKYPKHRWHVGVAWHYTSVAGCYGIFANQELWASSASMLNDTGEMTYGISRVHEVYKTWCSVDAGITPAHRLLRTAMEGLELSMLESPPFVLSASTSPFLLNQWANYGDASGCCIGLDGLSVLHVIGRTGHVGQREILPLWLTVLYESDEQAAYIAGLLDELVKPAGLIATAAESNQNAPHLLFQNLAMLVASLKHPAYEAEREVRFVVTRMPGEALSFRPTTRGIVPYLRLGGTTNHPTKGVQLPADPLARLPLPISEVFVGPPQGRSEQRRVESMREFLSANGYAAEVQGAGIPYLP